MSTDPRLSLEPTASLETILDGAWWPRTADAVAELPGLIDALTSRHGTITHVLLNSADWAEPHPRDIHAGGRTVRLGWYTSQPTGLLTMIIDFNRARVDLLVVPQKATADSAATAMTAAASAGNTKRAGALLADIKVG